MTRPKKEHILISGAELERKSRSRGEEGMLQERPGGAGGQIFAF